MNFENVSLNTFGYALPPNVLTSTELEEKLSSVYRRLRLPQGRLELMSGIRERRFWNKGTTPSQAAALAGKDVLARSDISAKDVEALFFTSVSRDMMEPATATFVHRELGLSENALVMDISNACLGFLNGILTVANMIELGQIECGLVVSGETAEDLMESTITTLLADTSLTRKSIKPAFASLTIGSGAIAVLITKSQRADNKPRLKHAVWQTRTHHNNLCKGGDFASETTLMDTDSEALLHHGVMAAKATWDIFSKKPGWGATDIDRFFCHQVGTAHTKRLFEELGLDLAKNYQSLPILGNIGSVSVPITAALGIENGAFLPGQKAAMLGIGSGINCMMLGVSW